MILNKIDDPRDNLEKANRRQLVEFAQANGQRDITEQMAADDIRRELRRRGITRIQIQTRQLGATGRRVTLPMVPKGTQPQITPGVVAVSADEFQRFKEWQRRNAPEIGSQPPAPLTPKQLNEMSINELRAACKDRNIKLDRGDNKEKLREKLNGENPSRLRQ